MIEINIRYFTAADIESALPQNEQQLHDCESVLTKTTV